VLAEATGDAELMMWDGREFGHWFNRSFERGHSNTIRLLFSS